MTMGRPSPYTEDMPMRVGLYLQDCKTKKEFPTLAGCAVFMGFHKETLLNWAAEHPDFFDAVKQFKDHQEADLVQGALKGAYNATFSIFFAKNNLGYKDKHEQEHSGEVGYTIKRGEQNIKPNE